MGDTLGIYPLGVFELERSFDDDHPHHRTYDRHGRSGRRLAVMGYGGWGMGGFGGVGMILFWIVLILAIVWLARALDLGRTFPRRDSEPRDDERRPEQRALAGKERGDGALKILRERYARGEIDSDEFERRKQDLLRKDDS